MGCSVQPGDQVGGEEGKSGEPIHTVNKDILNKIDREDTRLKFNIATKR